MLRHNNSAAEALSVYAYPSTSRTCPTIYEYLRKRPSGKRLHLSTTRDITPPTQQVYGVYYSVHCVVQRALVGRRYASNLCNDNDWYENYAPGKIMVFANKSRLESPCHEDQEWEKSFKKFPNHSITGTNTATGNDCPILSRGSSNVRLESQIKDIG